jgi:putative nucleotidyltransferase with HDIG domain
MDALGLTEVVLPEVAALRGVGQGVYHHLDVHDHTMAVLGAVLELERDPSPLGVHGEATAAVLAEPLADELTRWQALRLGALLHDVAKPYTRHVFPTGKVGFPGHSDQGADMARDILARLRASEKLRAHVAGLARHHLRLGFLVHEQPLSRRAVYGYLRACEPVEVDVTVLSVADRLATRGRRAEEAIAKHLELAHSLLGDALAFRAAEPAPPLVRGDELARELGIAAGPELGRVLAELDEARFAGEIATRDEAIAHARAFLGRRGLDTTSTV